MYLVSTLTQRIDLCIVIVLKRPRIMHDLSIYVYQVHVNFWREMTSKVFTFQLLSVARRDKGVRRMLIHRRTVKQVSCSKV